MIVIYNNIANGGCHIQYVHVLNFVPVDECAAAAGAATVGGLVGGVLLSAAIGGVIAIVGLYRAKKRQTTKLDLQ